MFCQSNIHLDYNCYSLKSLSIVLGGYFLSSYLVHSCVYFNTILTECGLCGILASSKHDE